MLFGDETSSCGIFSSTEEQNRELTCFSLSSLRIKDSELNDMLEPRSKVGTPGARPVDRCKSASTDWLLSHSGLLDKRIERMAKIADSEY
jgi:hypothetical protein